MSETTDMRRHPRFVVDVRARVSLRAGKRLDCRTRDVSRTGICLITETPMVAGEALRLDLVLAFGEDAFSEPLTLSARVVWCTPLSQSFQVGAMFDEITDEQDGYLEMFLQYLDGTLSPRGGADRDDDDDDGPAPPSPNDKDDPFRG